MADTPERPLIKLTPEAKNQLIGLESAIKQSEHALKVAEEMGFDVTGLRKELETHKKRREILLREFG